MSPPDPQALIRSGVNALRGANTGRLRLRVADGRRETETTGAYRIQERAHRSEVTLRTGGDTARRTSILRRGTLYAELTDAAGDADPEATCWAVGRAKDLRRFDGTFEVADVRGLPPALLAAGTAAGGTLLETDAGDVAGSGTQITGTLDLFYVLNAFGAEEAGDLGIAPGENRVAATLRLEDEVLSGFTVTGEELSEATLRAGTLLGAYPAEAVVEVDFSDPGRDVDLGLPLTTRRFAVSQDSGLLGLRDCLVARSDSRESAPTSSHPGRRESDGSLTELDRQSWRFLRHTAPQTVMMGS